jgi:hypothetical protein
MKQPPDPYTHHLAVTRPAVQVTELWASEQLRVQIQRNNAALAQELQGPGRQRHSGAAEPNAEPEAEP